MPTYAQPPLPGGLGDAIEVLGGSAARIAILRYLVEHPDRRLGEISQGARLSVGTTKDHLAHLVDKGVVVPDPPPSVPYAERRGTHLRYAVDPTVLQSALMQLCATLGVDVVPAPAAGGAR